MTIPFRTIRTVFFVLFAVPVKPTITSFNAENPTSAMSMKTYAREYFARVKMFMDILTGKQPASLEGMDQ